MTGFIHYQTNKTNLHHYLSIRPAGPMSGYTTTVIYLNVRLPRNAMIPAVRVALIANSDM